MASFLDKIKIKSAVGRSNKFDLSCDHVTTQEFFNLRPIYNRELMPKQSINVRASSFMRMAPLFKPMFGNVKLVNRAFFVPYRTVFEGWNAFITDTELQHDGQSYKITQVPTINTTNIVRAFTDSANGLAVVNSSTSTPDFVLHTNSIDTKFRFTRKGRIANTILKALGYNWSWTDQVVNVDYNMLCSALPILCFAKVIADWYCNPQYNTRRNAINGIISACWNGGQHQEVDDNIGYLLSLIAYSLYDNDYFTSAFDNPQVPNDGTYSSVSLPDFPLTKSTYNYSSSGTIQNNNYVGDTHISLDPDAPERPAPYIESKTSLNQNDSLVSRNYTYKGLTGVLTQFMVDSLKALTDYIKRYQLVGSQALDRYMAQFGVQLGSEKLNRSVYIGKSESNIQVSDVMSTADTQIDGINNPTGAYAGKGLAWQQGEEFSYSTDEFGLFLVVSTVLPRVSYGQGLNRMNLHIDRFDFFNGDFDALGTQAIARAELFNDVSTGDQFAANTSWTPSGVFGYTPRYAEYAVANDWLSGDFRVNSLNSDLEAWHLFRMFNPDDADIWSLLTKHSEQFSVGDSVQYNRIFNYSDTDADHFFAVHHFDVSSRMPKKPLYDQYEFDDGNSMLMHLGGTNLN